MYDTTKVTDNYGDYGGNDWWVEGTLHLTGSVDIADTAPLMKGLTSSSSAADIVAALKAAGLAERDDWVIDAEEITTTTGIPAKTVENMGHITDVDVDEDGTTIVITLDCKVADLEDSDHGSTWGTHKWLGFGVDSGLESITGIKFTDAVGATATLGAGDIAEATTAGLNAGNFVLYIKAENTDYLEGNRKFTLDYAGYKTGIFAIKIVEASEA
jgi:hypothetical protein